MILDDCYRMLHLQDGGLANLLMLPLSLLLYVCLYYIVVVVFWFAFTVLVEVRWWVCYVAVSDWWLDLWFAGLGCWIIVLFVVVVVVC